MICDDVRRIIYFFLDGALGKRKQQDFNSHLGLCPDCQRRAELQQRLRTFVRGRLQRLCAPPHLKTRLVRSVRAFRTEWASGAQQH